MKQYGFRIVLEECNKTFDQQGNEIRMKETTEQLKSRIPDVYVMSAETTEEEYAPEIITG